jgi:hypothetical protein
MRSELIAARLTVAALAYAVHMAPPDEAPASPPPPAVAEAVDSTTPSLTTDQEAQRVCDAVANALAQPGDQVEPCKVRKQSEGG